MCRAMDPIVWFHAPGPHHCIFQTIYATGRLSTSTKGMLSTLHTLPAWSPPLPIPCSPGGRERRCTR